MTFEQKWDHFWQVVGEKKDIHELNKATQLYNVAKEYLGYSPRQKLTEEEKMYILSLERGSEKYNQLYAIYRRRVGEYRNK